MPDLAFGLFSGYVYPENSPGKGYHYIAALSESNYLTDPVMIWFNGGPPCSSLIGFLRENGPYLNVNDSDPTFYPNPSRWNKEVTMIWLEAPAGVGFSYCDAQAAPGQSHQDYCTYDDYTTADENARVIL